MRRVGPERGKEGGGDTKVFDGVLQAFPVCFVPHGSGGGACICRRAEEDEDGDVVGSGRGQGSSVPGLEGGAHEGIGEGQVNGTGPEGA